MYCFVFNNLTNNFEISVQTEEEIFVKIKPILPFIRDVVLEYFVNGKAPTTAMIESPIDLSEILTTMDLILGFGM